MIINVTIKCRICGTNYDIPVYEDDLKRYEKGALVQDAFPYLSNEERELFISRTCDSCWKEMFSFDEDEIEEMM